MNEIGPGARIGEFVIETQLGAGGMGVVYRARQTSLGRVVALKVLRSQLGLTDVAIRRFLREAQAAAKLHHTNIVPVFAQGEEGGIHFYAMQLIEGESLDRVLKRLREGEADRQRPGVETVSVGVEAPVSYEPTDRGDVQESTPVETDRGYFDTVARWVADVADALDHAHREGVIHRDVKPSNLILSREGRMSIMDFGLARMLEEPGMTTSGELLGTPLYMSPEQIAASRAKVDHRTDIYSLGATLYELLTLRPPFPGESRDQVIAQIISKEPKPPRKWNGEIPADLETICLKAIEKDPDKRYQTGAAFAEDLRRYIHRFAITARRVGPLGRLKRFVLRRRVEAAAVVLVVVLASVTGVVGWRAWHQQRAREAAELVGEASDLRAENRRLEAIERLQRAVQLKTDHPSAWADLGELLVDEKRAEEAHAALERALELDGEDPRIWQALARAEGLLGRWKRAEDAASEAIRLAGAEPASERARILRLRASFREQGGDISGSLEDLQEAETLLINVRKGIFEAADRDLHSGRPLEALKKLTTLPPSDRKRPGWILRRALVLEAMAPEADEERLRDLQGLGIPPPPAGLTPHEAIRFQAQKDLDAAEDGGSKDPRLHAARARIATARGDHEAALAGWGRVLETSPDDREARLGRASILAAQGRWQDARTDVDRLLELDPEDAEARYQRGISVLLGKAEMPEAPEGVVSSVMKGAFLLMLFGEESPELSDDERRLVREDLEAAIRGGVQVRDARYYRAAVLSASGETQDALEEIESLLKDAPNDARLLAGKAAVLARANDLEGAELAAREATEKAPDRFISWTARFMLCSMRKDPGCMGRVQMALTEAMASYPELLREATGLFPELTHEGKGRERFGITLDDLAGGYTRFQREGLSAYVNYLGSENEVIRAAAERQLWQAGPGALKVLQEASAGEGGAADRARELQVRLREAVEQEEEELVAGWVEGHIGRATSGNPQAQDIFLKEAERYGKSMVPVFLRIIRGTGEPTRTMYLSCLPEVLGLQAKDQFLSLLESEDPRILRDVLPYAARSRPVLEEEPPSMLTGLLEHEDPAVRAEAARQLAPFPALKDRVEGMAGKAIRDDNEHRAAYADALFIMGSLEGARDLLEILKEEKAPGTRRELVTYLARLGGEGAREALRSIVKDPQDHARAQAVEGLGLLGGREDVALLITLLREKDADVVAKAASALGRLGDPDAVDPLLELLKRAPREEGEKGGIWIDPSLAPSWSLRAMGRPEGLDPIRRGTAQLFVTPYMSNWMPMLELGDPELWDTCLKEYRQRTGTFRFLFLSFLAASATEKQVPVLLKLLDSGSITEREILLPALGHIADPRAVASLEALLDKTKRDESRVLVAWTLSRCGKVISAARAREWPRAMGNLHGVELLARGGDTASLNFLRRTLEQETRALTGKTIEYMTRGLDLSSPSLRLQAAQALAYCGERKVLPIVAEYLDSRYANERRRAWQTLRRITGKDLGYQPLAMRPELEKGRAAWEAFLEQRR